MKLCWFFIVCLASHSLLVDTCFAYRLQEQFGLTDEWFSRWDAHSGELSVHGCMDISLQLNKPPSKYSIVVGRGQVVIGILPAKDGCSIEASVLQSYVLGQSTCDFHELAVQANAQDAGQNPSGPFRQYLRLSSPCGNVNAKYRVFDLDKETPRRQLAGVVTAPSTGAEGGSPAPAPIPPPLNPAVPVPQNQSMPPALYTPGPSVNVACCCGQNNGYSGNSQSCCCGPISICCQATGFCVSQNCTAIFVGSTLIAGALISFMTCGVCIYRARASLHEPVHFWSMGRRHSREGEGSTRRPWRPLPVQAPPDVDEGTQRDCPVCLEEVTKNAEWVIFVCRHGTCRTCYNQLVGKPDGEAACPLCRTALTEPLPEGAPAELALQMQPMPREPAQRLEGSPSQQPTPPAARSNLARQSASS